MTPTRLAIIGILLYILYRLVVGPRQRSAGEPRPRQQRPAGGKDGPVQDVLVQDPVCHTYIPQKQSFVLQHKGRPVYFCSKKCRETFIAEAEEPHSGD